MDLLRHFKKVKVINRPMQDLIHDDVSIEVLTAGLHGAHALQIQPFTSSKKPLRAFRGKFKQAFKGQKGRSQASQQPLGLKTPEEVCHLPSYVSPSTDRTSIQLPASVPTPGVIDDTVDTINPLAPGAEGSSHKTLHAPILPALPVHVAACFNAPAAPKLHVHTDQPSHQAISQTQSSVPAEAPPTGNGYTSISIPARRRVKSCSCFVSSEEQVPAPGSSQACFDVESLKLRLTAQNLLDTELFLSPVELTTPNTPWNGSFDLDSRPDSGLGLSNTAEAEKWKRTCHVERKARQTEREAHQIETQNLIRKHQIQVEEMQKTMAETDERLSIIVSMHQGLCAKHDELQAQKKDSPTNAAKPSRVMTPPNENVILKSRLEQSDAELANTKQANRFLEAELNNTRYAKNIAEAEFAELHAAWQQEVMKNRELISNGATRLNEELAKMKLLYKKEAMTNMQLRNAMGNDPSKTAEMDHTVEHLQEELTNSQNVNNQEVAASPEFEKQTKSELEIAGIELQATVSQNGMPSEVAHQFCIRKGIYQQASNRLVDGE